MHNKHIVYYLASGGRDFLNGAHEDFGDDGDTHKTIEEAEEIEKGSHFNRPRELVDERQNQTARATVLIQRPIIFRHFPFFTNEFKCSTLFVSKYVTLSH
jgi:hypothetical protein